MIKNLINAPELPQINMVRGWVRTHRQSKSVSFFDLNDGTSIKGLQVVIAPETKGYQDVAAKITTGASVVVFGVMKESPAKGQKYEFHASEVKLIGESDAETYPLQKKGHTLEFLREHLHLRPRSNTFGAIARIRSRAAFAVHQYFQERDFYYLTSPIISTSDCEGAGAMFRVTTFDLDKVPLTADKKVDYSKDFFGEEASLTVSGQLEGEAYATAISKIYTFGPTFRAENSNTTRHLAEFWMIEPEMAFYELKDNQELAQDFVIYLLKDVLKNCEDELKFLQEREWTSNDHIEVLQKVSESKFETVDYTEAVKILEKSGRTFEFPVSWGIDLQSEHERFLTDEHFKGPVTVVNYPKEIKAFYMRLNEDEKTVRAMDVLVPRLGEIIGGSQREERYEVLLQKMKAQDLDPQKYSWYLDLRKFGTVPHSGFGLGFERFLMYVSGMQNIRDVIPFPRYPGAAK